MISMRDFPPAGFSSCMTFRGHMRILQKTPAWLSPYRGGCGYENQREIRATISLSESETAKLTLNRKKFFCIRQPLLSIRPNASLQKLTLGLAISGGQDRKKTPPVYMGVA